ncbi:hypothetical protein [Nonomuraea angiospora]
MTIPFAPDSPQRQPHVQMEATAAGQSRVYQSAGHQTINHHYPPTPEPGQIVEGDIPQCPPGFQPRPHLLQQLADRLGDPAPGQSGDARGERQ